MISAEKVKASFSGAFQRIESNHIITAIKSGLVMALPVLMAGSVSLIIRTFINGYISSPNAFVSAIYSLSTFIYDATFGIVAIYMACFISLCYMRQFKNDNLYVYGAPISAIAGLVILSGGLDAGIAAGSFGVKGMFSAIFAAILASFLYRKIFAFSSRMQLFSRGANVSFHNAMNCILPFVTATVSFALINLTINLTLEADSFQELFINATNHIFLNMGRNFGSSLLFVLISSFLWFFGIHGSDVLDHVASSLFHPGMELNMALAAAGAQPTEIYTKTFLDVFVLMGGCGALMALLIAIFIFSRKRVTRKLAKTAAIPMLFNVNEIMVFGLPIVLNHVFFIPFLLCPVVCLISSYFAVSLGLVPIVARTVEWTTPVFLSGYLATGSIAGTLLQLFNLMLGMAVYYPFIRLYDKIQGKQAERSIETLTHRLQEAERTGKHVMLTMQDDEIGIIAKMLAAELKEAIAKGKLDLYYQPQYNAQDLCVGAEALLRWNNRSYGMIYPPLIIRLAEETDFLFDLEKYVFEKATDDSAYFAELIPWDFKISINVTPTTLENKKYLELLKDYSMRPDFRKGRFCIEVTEQGALTNNRRTHHLLEKIHAMGYYLAIDDFAMGSTSLKYLQNNAFDLVKLDGSLVKNLKNTSSREIIASILYLSKSLGFLVLAEFVETEEIRSELEKIGCTLYQGYLYSPAVKKHDLAELILKKPAAEENKNDGISR